MIEIRLLVTMSFTQPGNILSSVSPEELSKPDEVIEVALVINL